MFRPRPDASVDAAEVARFAALAGAWWDPNGEFRPLHQMNPVRLAYIRDRLLSRFGVEPRRARPLSGLRVLDVGCGGGLIAEPLTRLGASVVGIDAAAESIQAATAHAAQSELAIDYRAATAEELAQAGETFDAVLALEIIEHVADRDVFLGACAALVKPGGGAALNEKSGAPSAPGGLLIVSTLNRTLKAYLLAIVGAEYVLRWLPAGTHDWRKFVQPHELARELRRAGLTLGDVSGMTYNPLTGDWTLTRDADVNYLALALKD
jgi:2-polyprenyl-6-hydroxyphenyl methylase/3-demethylubiquinone-9 3-methyltransferase